VTAPMADERLAEYRDYVAEMEPPNWVMSHTLVSVRELIAEIDRLRAALAARPEPIGYVVADKHLNGAPYIVESGRFYPSLTAVVTYGPPEQVCALVPVEATP
jgi:hypothetical protein